MRGRPLGDPRQRRCFLLGLAGGSGYTDPLPPPPHTHPPGRDCAGRGRPALWAAVWAKPEAPAWTGHHHVCRDVQANGS